MFLGFIAPPGFEPGSAGPEPAILDHCTTGLRKLLMQNIFILLLLTKLMVIGATFFIIAVLVISIWVIIEMKRMKHKIFAIVLIALILFSYLSATIIFREHDVDFKTAPGVIDAGKIYFSWLSSVFVNFKTITTNAIHMEWGSNKTGT